MKLSDINLGDLLRHLEAELSTFEVGIDARGDFLRVEAGQGKKSVTVTRDVRQLPEMTPAEIAAEMATAVRRAWATA